MIYVESPFQLLQAVELTKESKNIRFLIRLNDQRQNNEQLKQLVSLFNLNKVHYLTMGAKVMVGIAFIPILICSYLAQVVYIGDENSIVFRLLKGLVPKGKIVLLDDGVATLNSKLGARYKRFSIFNTVNGSGNYLSESKKLVEAVNSPEPVNIIVGSKLVEEEICTKESYFSLLENMLLNSAADLRTLYVPHRGENESNLQDICSRFGVGIVSNRLPIELVGYEFSVRPVNICSVLSTALFSMSLIYDNANIRVCPLKSEDILSRNESIEKLYSLMKESSMFGISKGTDCA
ncbi:MAG: hypothetical protein KYX62_00605 [Pseudomonadota bacterium]|nr:hypothetical protein [Pseudomonadota bacterium]